MSISKIKGKNVDIHLWTPVHEIESSALDQLKDVASLPWVFHHVAVMPDVHTGKGATIGSVIAMRGAIAPSAVGVDIGCVDRDTEYLSPEGWRRISDYDGGQVMQYDAESGVGSFVEPQAFIKLPCDKFLRIKTKYGVDQMLSVEHKVLFAKYDRSFKFDKLDTIQAGDLAGHHNRTSQGFRGRFLTTFTPEIETSLDLSDEQIRVAVMVAADGCFNSSSKTSTRCSLRLKKTRKIERARLLLGNAQIEFTEHTPGDGVTEIRFYAPRRLKSLGGLWSASVRQLQLVADEVIQWDGNKENRCFYSRDKASADFVSYVFAALGFRSVMRADAHKRDGRTDYRVFFHYNDKVGVNGPKKSQIEFVPSEDGLKYCFTLPSGFWVMRRGGVIAVTGNCGMIAQLTDLTASQLPDNLRGLRDAIEAKVPVGFNHHSQPVDGTDRLPLWQTFNQLPDAVQDRDHNSRLQIGTLGGGNHFIEVCLDKQDRVWLMLHSGSRNIGLRLANLAIKAAKRQPHNKGLPSKDLAVLLEGSPEMESYKRSVFWAQEYALANRQTMLKLVQRALEEAVASGVTFDAPIHCHHNYVSEETHFNERVFVTRKGAIRARRGEMAIIPGSMGTRSYIVEGLGSAESFESAAHGAGRVMSRSKAKKTFTMDDVAEQLAGVECRQDRGILDELPGAYKDIDRVMDNQKDLVRPTAVLKQVLVVKG